MANLTTSFMGVALKNPIILGASNLTADLEAMKLAEDAGIAAVVYKSLFEEQVYLETIQFDDVLHEYDNRNAEMESIFPHIEHGGPKEHIFNVKRLKETLSIPVFASINAIYGSTWVEYAKLLDEVGVDGIELNFYNVPGSTDAEARVIEDHQIQIIKQVKAAVKAPISVKLSPFYSNPLNFITKLDKAGAKGIVIFNRFFQPEIDIETEKFYYPWELTRKGDYQVTLRYVGLLYDKISASICASRGIKSSSEVIKMVLAGADAVQMVSAFHKQGLSHVSKIVSEIEEWMDSKNYKSLADFKGKLSREKIANPYAYQRAHYIDILKNPDEIIKKELLR